MSDRALLAEGARVDAPVRSRRLMLIGLTLIYTLNYVDRQIVTILQEPIKAEYRLQDWQLGLLTGAAISLFYTAASIPIANLVDRGVRRVHLIAVITALWSILTALCGVTRSYGEFIIARMGVGLAEAGFAPAGHSLISDLYPQRQRPAAMGIFALGVPLGIMFGLSIGGTIAQWYDWRTALLIVGLPGLFIALAFRLLGREPVRGASDQGQRAPIERVGIVAAWRVLIRRPGYVHILLGSSGSALACSGVLAWLPSFLIRVHGMSLSHVGMALGLLTGIAGLVGTSAGGWQAGRLGVRGLHAMLWVPIAALILAIPLFILALLVSDGWLTLGLLVLPVTLTYLWSAPSIALVQSLAPVSMRATASAIYIALSNLIGVAGGPLIVGIASDVLSGWTGSAAQGLRWALVLSSLLLLWGIAHWVLAMRALERGSFPEARNAPAHP
ncbi:spinster family MFS transporter [Flavisphingomonas formosensis]|uniref:spinster family MFS transporter n=1 Tax=Flavisphingomonas formosensis TaxID=861534 RepID=UPI0012FB6D80|nr:MFS transporter [Sphingomonas formosensis]